ncbi:glycosyltransferase [Botrimarina mediterranea]|uniref:Putative glycosyl transferase n=1 Tax=Botrimarina mediterranea TaxID=2528022 RepID=A0A518K3E0_9BACT|nr:glycosyltransferase [Botrimarina mediterranea]QDV72280.1 putative glycosyl transferase [Botrimarina mediterranea]QDV76824.1 putative glycosyl transferase [Planctomycetes bacterium K2D]
MQSSLTVVLPVHNAERSLRRDILDVLDAAAELTSDVEVLVVDDASTDDSFETASEMSREYRQVRVLRRSRRQSLQETLREVRASIRSDVVIVHDGSSRVNPNQLRLIWRQQQVLGAVRSAEGGRDGVSFADLRRPSMTQPAMEAAHRRLWGFQRSENSEPAATPAPAATAEAAQRDANLRADDASSPRPAKRGVGIIPPLPRANVLGSLADFALGE